MVQNLHTILRHKHQILDPHTHIARQIDTRLNGKGHAGYQENILPELVEDMEINN